LRTLARAFSSYFKTKFIPALGWKVGLMLPSSVICWQKIDEQLHADNTHNERSSYSHWRHG